MPDTENQRSERRVLLIQGHPGASERHFIHAKARLRPYAALTTLVNIAAAAGVCRPWASSA